VLDSLSYFWLATFNSALVLLALALGLRLVHRTRASAPPEA
jgi:hypothetical protein